MQSNSDSDAPKPAATVVLLRDGSQGLELLYLKRNSELAFFGGAWVFPGGRIDPKDFDQAGSADLETAARFAAVREAKEEANVGLDPDDFVLFSEWTTPPGRPRRFRTWFYLAAVDQHEIEVDGGEIHDYRWIRPEQALSERQNGEIELPGPTFVTTYLIAQHQTAAAAIEAARLTAPTIYIPKTLEVPGGRFSLYEGDAGYENKDPEVPGPRHRLHMMDGEWRYEKQI